MKKNKKDPIPENFKSAEEAGSFWDVHDLVDYWDQTRETDLTFNLKRRRHFIGIDPKIAQELQRLSAAEGISSETMANLWIQEKLQEKARKGGMRS
jgi:hypothetical protein